MKTNTISPKKTFLYSFIGFLSILLYSCGSYQNSSYYDSDGIYGNTDTRTIVRTTERVVETNPNTPYKEYFNSLQNNNQPTEIFTDVDSYGNYDTVNDSIQVTNSGYSGWGSNPQDINVTVYDNGWNNWYGSNWYGSNWGFGFGFNNWYGAWGYPYYGWEYPSYGWSYPYYGWGYPSYGYTNNYYTYNPGRRGSSYSNRVNTNRNYSSRNYSQNQINTVSRNNNSTNFRRNSSTNLNRTAPTFTRGTQSQTRNNSTNPVRTRVNTNTNTTRSESYTPSRSNNSNNSYSPSRSSGNSGSGRSSGGGGGRSRG
jgi:hypothetical protein